MKIFIKLVYYLIAIIFMTCCSSDPQLKTAFEKPQNSNPLDLILGEKLINSELGEIRQSNFLDFLTISRKNLAQKSELYNVTPIRTAFYAINQKRTYTEARMFSAILKVEEEIVVKYQIMNDFQIIDKIKDSKGLFVLFGNFGNFSKYWKTNSDIQLIRYDNSLNQLWVYAPKSSQFPLEAIEINDKDDYMIVKVNVVTGCHICTNTFELKIDSLGNCFSAIEIYKTNSSVSLNKHIITEVFKIPHPS